MLIKINIKNEKGFLMELFDFLFIEDISNFSLSKLVELLKAKYEKPNTNRPDTTQLFKHLKLFLNSLYD